MDIVYKATRRLIDPDNQYHFERDLVGWSSSREAVIEKLQQLGDKIPATSNHSVVVIISEEYIP